MTAQPRRAMGPTSSHMYTMDIRNMTGVPGNISDLSRKHSDGPRVSPMEGLQACELKCVF